MKTIKTQTPVILESLNSDLKVEGILITSISIGYPVFIYTNKNKWFITQKVKSIEKDTVTMESGVFKIYKNDISSK